MNGLPHQLSSLVGGGVLLSTTGYGDGEREREQELGLVDEDNVTAAEPRPGLPKLMGEKRRRWIGEGEKSEDDVGIY